MSLRAIILIRFIFAAMGAWITLSTAYFMGIQQFIHDIPFALGLISMILGGYSVLKAFSHPILSAWGVIMLSIGFGLVLGPGPRIIPVLGMELTSIAIYMVAATITFPIILIMPAGGSLRWIFTLWFLTSAFGSILIWLYKDEIGLSVTSYGYATVWGFYLHAIFMLSLLQNLVDQNPTLDKAIDWSGKVLFDQCTLALRKLSIKVDDINKRQDIEIPENENKGKELKAQYVFGRISVILTVAFAFSRTNVDLNPRFRIIRETKTTK